MSKGSKIVPVRLPEELSEQVAKAIASQNFYSRKGPSTVSEWIRQAIQEKLAHIKRSRAKRKVNAGQPPEIRPLPPV